MFQNNLQCTNYSELKMRFASIFLFGFAMVMMKLGNVNGAPKTFLIETVDNDAIAEPEVGNSSQKIMESIFYHKMLKYILSPNHYITQTITDTKIIKKRIMIFLAFSHDKI